MLTSKVERNYIDTPKFFMETAAYWTSKEKNALLESIPQSFDKAFKYDAIFDCDDKIRDELSDLFTDILDDYVCNHSSYPGFLYQVDKPGMDCFNLDFYIQVNPDVVHKVKHMRSLLQKEMRLVLSKYMG